MELDFSVLKNKINETLVISHAGILVPFFLGIVASYWIYEEYAAAQTAFLPFALFIGISMSITAFPVLARIIRERNMTKTSLGTLAIASAANDDVTALVSAGCSHRHSQGGNVCQCPLRHRADGSLYHYHVYGGTSFPQESGRGVCQSGGD